MNLDKPLRKGKGSRELLEYAERVCAHYPPGLTSRQLGWLFSFHVGGERDPVRLRDLKLGNSRVIVEETKAGGSLVPLVSQAGGRDPQIVHRDFADGPRGTRALTDLPGSTPRRYQVVSQAVLLATGAPLAWHLLRLLRDPDLRRRSVRDGGVETEELTLRLYVLLSRFPRSLGVDQGPPKPMYDSTLRQVCHMSVTAFRNEFERELGAPLRFRRPTGSFFEIWKEGDLREVVRRQLEMLRCKGESLKFPIVCAVEGPPGSEPRWRIEDVACSLWEDPWGGGRTMVEDQG